ncbi:putative PEP-binding protein [Engelhardtia mirabilis]|uniref:Phosphoenolpyruvate-protein phosphotransferase n=1 Tax=Engelhardtia mirabilis TaxID=2528011 RepID=A0A518BMZ8_9BACT|nr:Phosphoenolpyruvate-protein phosphotransferase [Planctomycetes bacterium Pla133]QDV02687.1 Phosphoenolpyruvate-protein phosphotransferase [Planctomycetes bacterium Pla86]
MSDVRTAEALAARQASEIQGTPEPAGAPTVAEVLTLRGERASRGRVAGRLVVVPDALGSLPTERIARDAVEDELNRFRRALGRARNQLRELRERLKDEVGAEDARILDTHLALSKDSAFIADVENLILESQLRLETAIGKVVGDFDRIFRLVKSEELRRGAADLRDVGLRVLRNLDGPEGPDTVPAVPVAAADDGPRILVARELSVVDLFDLERGAVAGLVAETGGGSSHAAILARSMGVPALTGVEGAFESLRDGQWAVLDADAGVLRVSDDPAAIADWDSIEAAGADIDSIEVERLDDVSTRDGRSIAILPLCSGRDEVARVVEWGAREIGLVRTEMAFVTESTAPDVARLETYHRAIADAAGGARVSFRLLHADAKTPLPFMDAKSAAARQPGVRFLRAQPELLQNQLAALLMVAADDPVRIAIPFVDDVDSFIAVRDALVAARESLRKLGRRPADDVQLGVTIDTPGALFGLEDLCEHANFVHFNVDALVMHLMVADRTAPVFRPLFERLHPFVLRALAHALEAVHTSGVEHAVFGGLVDRPENVPLLLALGFRRLCPSLHATPQVVAAVRATDMEAAGRQLDAARRAGSHARGVSPVAGFHHGFASGEGD